MVRDLRRAAREGRHAFIRSLAHFPRRHPFWIAGTAFGIVAVLGILGYYETNRKVTHVDRSVTKIEAASPCITYGPKSELCKRSFEQAVLTITHPEACAILRKAGLEVTECAHARLRQEQIRHRQRVKARGGDAPQPASHAGQQSGPSKGGRKKHGGAKGPRHHAPQQQAPAPAPPSPSPAAPSAPSPPPVQPGHSGDGASAEHGVSACVELTVSACIKTELP